MRLIDADEFFKNFPELAIEPYINAPTVETDIEVVAKDAYEQGYTDGWKERFGEPNERPQGEWIKIGEIGLAHKCNKCGEVEVAPTNFCPNCGAQMLKGEKTNEL